MNGPCDNLRVIDFLRGNRLVAVFSRVRCDDLDDQNRMMRR